ncbi:SRPBCC family protein [Reichenbachiella versicolor]|uniref:SRPBCC family protein n=1 Tax=Reichenbachiella versicolor TaxID=1821036 RepID=UPI000D6DCF89|nr:SRPBCC domain-containing protein [Reichenbachiella versicolor]
MENTITLNKKFNHPIEKVWEAISDQEKISEWFLKADFKAEVGYNYTFQDPKCTVTGEVKEVSKPNQLDYTWIVGGTTTETSVSWILTQDGDTTVLDLKHWGIENYADAAPNFFASFNEGWNKCFASLDEYLSSIHAQ